MNNATGDTHEAKTERWRLWDWEQRWIRAAVPHVPHWLNGKNLTYATLLFAILAAIVGWAAQSSLQWLWVLSAIIIGQYVTDSLDGAVGRYRGSGLKHWGHYMDHLFDFLFLGGLIMAYAFILPDMGRWLLALMIGFGALFVSTYLLYGITQEFQMGIARIGMNEAKIALILINALMVFIGIRVLEILLPILTVVVGVVLIINVAKIQSRLYRRDTQHK